MNAIVIVDQIEADLTYLSRMRERPFYYTATPPEGGPASNGRYESHRMQIRNARRAETPISLDSQGFLLVRHRTDGRLYILHTHAQFAMKPHANSTL